MILFVFCVLQIHLASSQFPDHVDFQKVGEVYLAGVKHNILKISKHLVRDHFLNFMQRRESTDIPTKRIFLDKNGFRHYWSNFQEGSLKSQQATRKGGVISDKTGNITGDESNTNVNSYVEDKSERTNTRNETSMNPDDLKGKENEASKNKPTDKVILRPSLRGGKAAPAKNATKPNGEKTLAITQFFCPFFGVLTLSAYVD